MKDGNGSARFTSPGARGRNGRRIVRAAAPSRLRSLVAVVALAVPLLTAIDVVAPTVASATADYSSTVMSASPTAYWRLGDGSGSSTAADASGNGHMLTATGVTFGRPGAIVGDSDTAVAVQDNGNESDAVGSFAFAPSGVTAEVWIGRRRAIRRRTNSAC